MNTILLHFTNDMKEKLFHKIGNPKDPKNYRVNIDFTSFNEIKNIIGFYKNGVFVEKGNFYFRNGIFEMENMLLDEQDKIFFVCLVNTTETRKYLMVYPIINYALSNDLILLLDDNIGVNRDYSIEGIIINGILYAGDEIEVTDNKSKIKFKNFEINKLEDELKLLIYAEG